MQPPISIIDRAFHQWERQNQPRRAHMRTVACSSSVDCMRASAEFRFGHAEATSRSSHDHIRK